MEAGDSNYISIIYHFIFCDKPGIFRFSIKRQGLLINILSFPISWPLLAKFYCNLPAICYFFSTDYFDIFIYMRVTNTLSPLSWKQIPSSSNCHYQFCRLWQFKPLFFPWRPKLLTLAIWWPHSQTPNCGNFMATLQPFALIIMRWVLDTLKLPILAFQHI